MLPGGLSPREWEAIGLLTRGLRYREIAEHMGVTYETIKTFMKRVRDKLQLRTNVLITIWAFRNGVDFHE